jgi:hypothetical protein
VLNRFVDDPFCDSSDLLQINMSVQSGIVLVDLTADTDDEQDVKVVLVDLTSDTADDEHEEEELDDPLTICTVCFRNMKAWDRDVLRCGHMFCHDCLLKWLGPCPVCRQPRV